MLSRRALDAKREAQFRHKKKDAISFFSGGKETGCVCVRKRVKKEKRVSFPAGWCSGQDILIFIWLFFHPLVFGSSILALFALALSSLFSLSSSERRRRLGRGLVSNLGERRRTRNATNFFFF